MPNDNAPASCLLILVASYLPVLYQRLGLTSNGAFFLFVQSARKHARYLMLAHQIAISIVLLRGGVSAMTRRFNMPDRWMSWLWSRD